MNLRDFIDRREYFSIELKSIYSNFSKGVRQLSSSSNLLLLNVEDILGFAQIKAGKFYKNIQRFHIKRLVEDAIKM